MQIMLLFVLRKQHLCICAKTCTSELTLNKESYEISRFATGVDSCTLVYAFIFNSCVANRQRIVAQFSNSETSNE